MDCEETTQLFKPYITKLVSQLCVHCRLDEDTSSVSGVLLGEGGGGARRGERRRGEEEGGREREEEEGGAVEGRWDE